MASVSTPTEYPSSVYGLSLTALDGVGPKRADLLANMDLLTVGDLLQLKPRHYDDRSEISAIVDAPLGETATLRGEVKSIRVKKGRNWKKRLEVTIDDGTAQIVGIWFNMPYLKEQFKRGKKVLFTGKVGYYKQRQMPAPEFEFEDTITQLNTGRIVPVYPLTDGIGQGLLRSLVHQALSTYAEYIPDILGDETPTPHPSLVTRTKALWNLHFPERIEDAEEARRHLAYEEFFLFQIAVQRKRAALNHRCEGRSFTLNEKIDQRIRRLFPFDFTAAQNRALREITHEMAKPQPMNRLIQGDVGSGKTAVALYAMLLVIANKAQTAIMAPTEILAKQHEETIRDILKDSNVRIASLVGSLKSKEKTELQLAIGRGDFDIVIGTHSLVQDKVGFKDLGLVIIDEQHKFGVLQRAKLLQKGANADLLLMSATPIPRTMAMTVYGDLDLSVIDELPPGRKPIETTLVSPRGRDKAFEFIREKIHEGQQVYCVYPLVEESEKLDLKSATEMADLFATEIFPEFSVALLHGKLEPIQKGRVMAAFAGGQVDILVSTVVIEVGVNVPNANIMIIEEAQRFGLAQIHQLRGRIGRGDQHAHCMLFASEGSKATKERLSVLTSTNDGFKISEADLQIRGPGEFMSTKQHGLPSFSYGDVMDDFAIMEEARNHAAEIMQKDPNLAEHKILADASAGYTKALLEF